MAEVTTIDKQNAEAILIAYLNENFPELETRKGSALRSLLISPAAAWHAKVLSDISVFRTSISIANIAESGFDESVIEAFLENLLVTRNEGSKSSGVLRVDASINKSYIVSQETIFVLDETLLYNPTEDLVFAEDGADEGNQTLFSDSETGTFFMLVPVTSTTSTDIVVEQGTLFTLDPGSFIDNSVVGIQAHLDFSQGKAVETLTEFQDRAEESITVRDLVTDKSIRTVIPDNFAEVIGIKAIGMGDQEMLRDLVLPHGIHKGGDVDIFVRTDKVPTISTIEKSVVANLEVDLLPPETPVFEIQSVELKSGTTLTTLVEGTDYEVIYSSTDLTEQSFIGNVAPLYSRFSPKEKISIRFLDISFLNQRVVITVSRPSSIQNIQDFVEDEDNRVVAANLLTRAFAPVFISMNVQYRRESTDVIVDETSMSEAIRDYVNVLVGTDTIEVSKIVAIVESYEGVRSVVLPLTVLGVVHKTDGTSENISTVDKLIVSSENSIGFSQRICQYILRAKDITLEVIVDD